MQLERIVRELQATGMLKQAVADQIAKYAQQISGQSERQATVRVRNAKAVHIETAEVPDPFYSPDAQARAVEWIKHQLWQVHEYYFTPSLDPEEEQRRIREFLADGDDESQQTSRQQVERQRSVHGDRNDNAPASQGQSRAMQTGA